MNDSYHHGPILAQVQPVRATGLQPVLVLTVHWWPAPVCVGGLLVYGARLLSRGVGEVSGVEWVQASPFDFTQ